MASLLDLLSQRQPNLQTRKGLILTGLQNDFLSPNGKLPVRSEHAYIEAIKELVPAFRDFGDVIWVRSQYEADREVTTGLDEAGDSVIAGPLGGFTGFDDQSDYDGDDHSPVPTSEGTIAVDGAGDRAVAQTPDVQEDSDADEELFLTNSAQREACCLKGSLGADFAPQIKDSIAPKDLQVIKTYYSAFGATSLLLTLRSKLITELYIGGNMTNLSVFATAMDAARYGIKVTLLEDCLGYRNKSRHEAAIKTLKNVMGADVLTGAQAIEALKNPPIEESTDEEVDDESEEEDDHEEEEEEEDIAVGEDAKGASPDDIEVDSDGDEEEEFDLLSTVRDQLATASRLPSRLASSLQETIGLQERAQGRKRASHARELQNAVNDSGSGLNQTEQEATESRVRREPKQIKNDVDRFNNHNAGADLKGDDSLTKVSVKAFLGGQGTKSISAELSRKSDDQTIRPVHSSHPGLNAIATLVGLDQRTVDEYESMMEVFKKTSTDGEPDSQGQPLFGEDKEPESAGSRILYDLLPSDLAETVFAELSEEVNWQTMHHQTGEVPRLVCCQGTIGKDGSMPVYRHPSDQTLPITAWTPTVDKVRKLAEEAVGHPLNHALIQLYRGRTDFISEHSDKTLDIAKESFIVNVSFGAQRTMRLRTKRGVTAASAEGASPTRTTYRVPMPHNSMITMSLPTNAEYLHGINADKRPRVELSEGEKAFDGQRISLTFRNIATFLSTDSSRIWGQGATGKTMEDAQPVINGDAVESERIVKAFGAENQAISIVWEATYGGGFDVLHLR